MRSGWWKAYFFLAVVLVVGSLALPFFFEGGWEWAWSEWISAPLYSAQLVGLFGFVFWRRFGVPPIWQIIFLASIAYEIWNWVSMATDPELHDTGYTSFLITTLAVTFALQLPMFIALFSYGFRSKELWGGAT